MALVISFFSKVEDNKFFFLVGCFFFFIPVQRLITLEGEFPEGSTLNSNEIQTLS